MNNPWPTATATSRARVDAAIDAIERWRRSSRAFASGANAVDIASATDGWG